MGKQPPGILSEVSAQTLRPYDGSSSIEDRAQLVHGCGPEPHLYETSADQVEGTLRNPASPWKGHFLEGRSDCIQPSSQRLKQTTTALFFAHVLSPFLRGGLALDSFNHSSTVKTSWKTPSPHPRWTSLRRGIPAHIHLIPLLSFLKLKMSVSTTRFQISQKQGQYHHWILSKRWLNKPQISSQRNFWMTTIDTNIINSQMFQCYHLLFLSSQRIIQTPERTIYDFQQIYNL